MLEEDEMFYCFIEPITVAGLRNRCLHGFEEVIQSIASWLKKRVRQLRLQLS